MLIFKWIIKSLASVLVMFGISGYLLFLSTGSTPWSLLGYSSPGAFFYSLLPDVNLERTAQSVKSGIASAVQSADEAVTQYVPSASWSDSESGGQTAMSEGAPVYKWVDSQGVTHFSETPPASGSSEKVILESARNVLPGLPATVEKKPVEGAKLLQQLQQDLEAQAERRQEVLEAI